ncbi:MAG: hypothetical protein H7Y17_13455 [Chlorobia bacterium]|nr:hypothetical protein [Fimbriimonadaceae bacterium]
MVTIEDIFAVAKSTVAQDWHTVKQRKPFEARVLGNALMVYPRESRTGKGIRLGEPPLQRMLDRFNASGSREVSQYAQDSKNRSYSLTLILAAFDRNSAG